MLLWLLSNLCIWGLQSASKTHFYHNNDTHSPHPPHFIVSLLKVLLEMAMIDQFLPNLCRVEKQATSVT